MKRGPRANPPAAPADTAPSARWKYRALYGAVREALLALPLHFEFRTVIDGIHAGDLQTLNTPLGAVIEDQIVETLNSLRRVWDPSGIHPTLGFRRQPQTFPDVLLLDLARPNATPVMGIEVKGWYVLAKEAVPTFRMQQSVDACASADLIVVAPWALSNVLAGTPRVVHPPFIAGSKYAAKWRNHYWWYTRDSKQPRTIDLAQNCKPYPVKSDAILDKATHDGGRNFGRLARTGVMDDYCSTVLAMPLAGVPVNAWRSFFKRHARPTQT